VVQLPGGTEVNTASFAMYTFSISVLLQALVIISMSGAADHGRYRKKLLLVFALAGAGATMLFLPMNSSILLLAAVLAIIGNICFGAANVLMNSFLPLLVRNHETVRKAERDNEEHHYQEDNHQPETSGPIDQLDDLLPISEPPSNNISPVSKSSPELRLSTQISAYGVGIGYIAAVILQISSIFLLLLMMDKEQKAKTFPLRLVLFLIGLWWAVFTIPAALWLRPRPGPPLPAKHAGSWLAYLIHSWTLLVRTIMKARQLRDITIFLVAWFLLSDALATVSGTAILFAKSELGMEAAALGAVLVIVTLFGILGAFAWSAAARYFKLSPIQTLAASIALFEIIPIYGLLGFIPAIRELGVLGLQQDWEMYPVGAIYGLVLGGVGAYCRALYAELIPPGSEAAFYALYAITDKGSSVFGPAIVGAITDRFGGIRPSFFFLVVLVGLPFPLLMFVDVARGREEGRKLARLQGNLGEVVYTAIPTTESESEHHES
jgi:MFS transporter, UMF1 family